MRNKKETLKAIVIAGVLSIVVLSMFGCGKKKEEVTTVPATKETTTKMETESETETETFRLAVNYTVVVDTSQMTDEETSNIISDLREKGVELHMDVDLGNARYQELELIITCHYNDDNAVISANEVREKLLEGLVIKSIQ